MLVVNMGGEGEVPGVLNQQPPGALGPGWIGQDGMTIAQKSAAGIPFLICDNDRLPYPDGSVDIVYTNSVPIDKPGVLGPGVQTSEIWRILRSGGLWIAEYGTDIKQKP